MTYAEAMKRAIRELEYSNGSDRVGRARAAEAWVAFAREIRESGASSYLQCIDRPSVDK